VGLLKDIVIATSKMAENRYRLTQLLEHQCRTLGTGSSIPNIGPPQGTNIEITPCNQRLFVVNIIIVDTS